MKALSFLSLAVIVCSVQGLFDFFKSRQPSSKAISEDTAIAGVVRGVSRESLPKYQQESFVCDSGRKKFNINAVNDDFCDCDDQSDEPGTNACNGATFHCINKGYKPAKLAASRVDDQICDCCDGSDEKGHVNCPNTCEALAYQEMGEIEKKKKAFGVGNGLRLSMEKEVTENLSKSASQHKELSAEFQLLTTEIADLESTLKRAEEAYSATFDQQEQAIAAQLYSLLKVDENDVFYSGQLLSSVFESLGFNEDQVKEHITFTPSYRPPTPLHDEETHFDDEIIDESGDSVHVAADHHADCALLQLPQHSHLELFCDLIDPVKEFRHVLLSLLKTQRPLPQLVLLIDYYGLYQSFVGSSIFVQEQMGQLNCAHDASSANCQTIQQLSDLVNKLENVSVDGEMTQEIQQTKQMIATKRDRLQTVRQGKDAAEKANHDLDKYRHQLAFVSLKGQCFDSVDGKFTYTLCMLESIKQKEIGGYNSVTLGEFSSIEESEAHGQSYVLHYLNGQYCHAFGPRKSEVITVCGEKNVLKSASEPSTCFYSFVFESPAACTEQYGRANGLVA